MINAFQVNVKECVTSAYMNALEKTALTEKQQEKVQVCEKIKNNRVSIMWELRELIRDNL